MARYKKTGISSQPAKSIAAVKKDLHEGKYIDQSTGESPWILHDGGSMAYAKKSGQWQEGGKYFIGLRVSKGKTTKHLNQLTGFEKIQMINEGLSKENLLTLKNKLGLDYDQLSGVLSVARATLINKKGDARFSRDLSEKIFSLADVYAYGYQVFENENRFNDWVFAPNHALGGQKPFDLLDSQYGREEIRNLIGRIEYGVYS